MSELVHITVVLLGRLADLAGEPRLEYALFPPARLDTLLALMGVKRPELGQVLAACRVTVNGADADANTILSDGDTVEIDSLGQGD